MRYWPSFPPLYIIFPSKHLQNAGSSLSTAFSPPKESPTTGKRAKSTTTFILTAHALQDWYVQVISDGEWVSLLRWFQSTFWSMYLAQRANYKRAVIARSESQIWRTTRSSSPSWNESKSSAQTGKRWSKKASFQRSGFRNKSVKSGAQGKVRSESRARNNKTSDKSQKLCLRNEMTFTPCDCERKELETVGA